MSIKMQNYSSPTQNLNISFFSNKPPENFLSNYGFCRKIGASLDHFVSSISKRGRRLFVRAESVVDMDSKLTTAERGGGSCNNEVYDAVVIGSGIGGLVAATQLAVKGGRVMVLEKHTLPGGSAGFYQKDGYTFDVGASVMFGLSDKGNHNVMYQALADVGCKLETISDPTAVHFHLPNNLSVQVPIDSSVFIDELVSKFPHEKEGIVNFYGECWKCFNALNSLEVKSLEEPLYLIQQFYKKPFDCLTLGKYLTRNAGEIARKYIKDPDLLGFIDAECFLASAANASRTPMLKTSTVVCDRHSGGINYPVGGVGEIAKSLAKGLVRHGSEILYKAAVTKIIIDNGKAVGVKLSDGRAFYGKTIISNATRWDTFGKLVQKENLPKEEEDFQKLYEKAPSFLSIFLGVKAEVLPPGTDCHHVILEDDWKNLERPYGTILLSIPTVLDSSMAPEGRHTLHIFTTSNIEEWEGLSRKDYVAKKELVAGNIIKRLEKKLFPGLTSAIEFKEVATPKTHRRYLTRDGGTYGPTPRGIPKGYLGMPFNTTGINGLYCVGDSCFPSHGVLAVAVSGVMCSHRVAADIGLERRSPILDAALLPLLKWFRSFA